MTTEEKAKAYDEAIKKAKFKLDCCDSDLVATKNTIYYIFSELEKSEDERIRKQILDCFKTMKQQGCFPSKHKEQYNSWIAWLEKQGEQKPVISRDALREGITHFGITQYQIDNWLKKYVDVERQGEQHIACSEEQMKVLDEILTYAANHEDPYWNDYILGTLNGLIKQLKRLKV